MTIDTIEDWHAGLILARRLDEVLELYAGLEPPDPTDLDGEYAGYAHLGPDAESALGVHGYVHDRAGKGYWLGKSFGLFDGTAGEGHNRLLQADGSVKRKERFSTRMGTSLIDGLPTFLIDYRDFDNAPSHAGFIDEIRTLAPGKYLLLATADGPDGRRTPPAVMFLEGPVGPWLGPDPDSTELPAS